MKTERAERLLFAVASVIVALMLLTCLASNVDAATCSIKIDGVTIESDPSSDHRKRYDTCADCSYR